MKIFISYRREDSRDITDQIYDHLASASGRVNIFKDVNSIPAGADFRKVLNEAISDADWVLVVIGPHWLEVADDSGMMTKNTCHFVPDHTGFR